MTEYVIGFLFNGEGEVCLNEKQRPAWQKGRINGVGGHIEKDETPYHAMVREFQEEAGCLIDTWRKFGTVKGVGYKLHLFTATGIWEVPETKTDEKIGWYSINNLPDNILPNLVWMIPMANYKLPITASVIHNSPEC